MNNNENQNPVPNNESEQDFVSYLTQILRIIVRRIIPILLVTVLVGAAAFFISMSLEKTSYVATTMIYISTRDNSDVKTVNTVDLNTAARLVSTYTIILKTSEVLQPVVYELNGYKIDENGNLIPIYETDEKGDPKKDENGNPVVKKDEYGNVLYEMADDYNNGTKKYYNTNLSQIMGGLSTSSVDDTEIFRISFTGSDRQFVIDAVNAVAEHATDGIRKVVNAGHAQVVEHATYSVGIVTPDKTKNTIIASAVAFVVTAALFVVIALLDNRIRNEDDLINAFGYPVFGAIPTIVAVQANPTVGVAPKKEDENE